MNKKLLFATMSLAALAACTTDDFESQKVAQETSPVQFEVINVADDLTRASMNGEKIVWNANDGDLFTLYHGAALGAVTGYENATYKANATEGGTATLSTPSMIKAGGAIMVWPVDTTFRITAGDNLSLTIPAVQTNIENNIPYVSDLVNIANRIHYNSPGGTLNNAGKDRKYPVFMRPMASQLIVKADYNNSDATLAQLYEGGSACPEVGDGVNPISVTNVDLLTQTGGASLFTTEIPVTFTAVAVPSAKNTQWDTDVPTNAWSHITGLDRDNPVVTADKLTSKCITGTESCKFLILPQAAMNTVGTGVAQAGVLVNTLYGRVVVAAPGTNYSNANYGYAPAATGATSAYTAAEYADAWYRYIATASTASDGETKAAAATAGLGHKTTANIEMGMKQTLNGFGAYTAPSGVAKDEPIGAAATRYVKVLLTHLDMSDLHIKNDKHLRDAARVWKHLNLPDVTVLLDGTAGEFEISQKTIQVINEINASIAGGAKSFKVMPCTATAAETCNTIRVTGGGNVQDMTFIVNNGAKIADVALKAGETWKWRTTTTTTSTVKVLATGVNSIINRGTFVSDATVTMKTAEANGTQNFVPFVNNGTWNVNNNATLNVQLNVTNNGTVNIAKGAQYRQDGNASATVFINEATAKPSRFGGNDALIGKVNNEGVFATVKDGEIYNYGLIEHADVDAKTYVTTNQTINGKNGFTSDAVFTKQFDATAVTGNKMGRINLPFSNKEEDNVSVSAALAQGFVSVTVTASDAPANGILNASVVGSKVNYIIVNGGINEVARVAGQVKYLEINQPGTEVAWNVTKDVAIPEFTGMMVLSPVNIKLNTRIKVTGACYIGADMYVGGEFDNGTVGTLPAWTGYYGNTSAAYNTKYITY